MSSKQQLSRLRRLVRGKNYRHSAGCPLPSLAVIHTKAGFRKGALQHPKLSSRYRFRETSSLFAVPATPKLMNLVRHLLRLLSIGFYWSSRSYIGKISPNTGIRGHPRVANAHLVVDSLHRARFMVGLKTLRLSASHVSRCFWG